MPREVFTMISYKNIVRLLNSDENGSGADEGKINDRKKDEEAITNLYKNAHIALQSISNIMPHATDKKFKNELTAEYEGYEKAIGEMSSFMSERDMEPKDINVFKKAMLSASIGLNAIKDDSDSHLAEMMVQGTVMGITEIKHLISDFGGELAPEITATAKKLCALEEGYEENLKKYL